MKKNGLRMIGIGIIAAVLCVCTRARTPVVLHALERNGAVRMTNYAPLYLDPVPEESQSDNADGGTGGAGAAGGENASGGTTVIDPNETQGGGSNGQEPAGSAESGTSGGTDATDSAQQEATGSEENGTSGGADATDSAQQEASGSAESGAAGSADSADSAQQGASGGGTGTSGSGTGVSGSGNGQSNATVTIPTNPYTANVNPKDMPATGVEDLRRGVVSVILILFGIIAILVSIPTLKGKRRSDR